MEVGESLIAFESIRSEVNFLTYLEEIYEPDEMKREMGNRLRIRCPFHDEKTPSLVVYLNTSSFTCFGCSKSGDVFDFIAAYEEISLLQVVLRYASEEHIYHSWRTRIESKPTELPLEGLYISVGRLLRDYSESDRDEICRKVDQALVDSDGAVLMDYYRSLYRASLVRIIT